MIVEVFYDTDDLSAALNSSAAGNRTVPGYSKIFSGIIAGFDFQNLTKRHFKINCFVFKYIKLTAVIANAIAEKLQPSTA